MRKFLAYLSLTLGLDLTFMRGQGYDGAGSMAGSNKGLASRVQAKYPLAWYFHCAGHILNLVIAADPRAVQNSFGIWWIRLIQCSCFFKFFSQAHSIPALRVRRRIQPERAVQDEVG